MVEDETTNGCRITTQQLGLPLCTGEQDKVAIGIIPMFRDDGLLLCSVVVERPLVRASASTTGDRIRCANEHRIANGFAPSGKGKIRVPASLHALIIRSGRPEDSSAD